MVRGRDPNAVAVLLEDSAAVTGLLLASGCLGLASYTGNMIYDAIGSISIGGKNVFTLYTPLLTMDIQSAKIMFSLQIYKHVTNFSACKVQRAMRGMTLDLFGIL